MPKRRDPLTFPLPQSADHERAVLGGCIYDNAMVPRVISDLTEDDFYHSPNKSIFRAVQKLYEERQTIDYLTITKLLQDQGILQAVGGIDYVSRLGDDISTSANTPFYIKICKEYGNRRRIIQSCREAVATCMDNEPDLPKIIGDLQQSCFNVISSRNKGGPKRFTDLNSEGLAALEKRYSEGHAPGLLTGFSRLDNVTDGGLRNGELIIIAARPSVGKTAFAIDVAFHIAQRKPTFVYELEMTDLTLWDRRIATESGVSLSAIRKGKLNAEDWDKITRTAGNLDGLQLWIDTTPRLTTLDIRSRTQNICLSERIEPGVIIIDYLQLMGITNKSDSRERQIATITGDLKELAKAFNCPIIALSQLNREIEKRGPHEQMPRLADLRESGAIEQDGDIILGLWRKWLVSRDDTDANHAELGILKQRNGCLGKFELFWEPQAATFRNHPRDQYQTDMEEF